MSLFPYVIISVCHYFRMSLFPYVIISVCHYFQKRYLDFTKLAQYSCLFLQWAGSESSNSYKYFTATCRATAAHISYIKLLKVDLASYPNCDKCPMVLEH